MRISDWSSDVCSSDLYHCACDRADPDPRAARRRGPGHDPGGNLHQRGDVKLRAQADHRCSHAGAVRRIDHAADRRFHARDIRTDTGTAAMIAPGLAGVEAQLWLWLIARSEEHTSELQSLMRTSYAVFCLK